MKRRPSSRRDLAFLATTPPAQPRHCPPRRHRSPPPAQPRHCPPLATSSAGAPPLTTRRILLLHATRPTPLLRKSQLPGSTRLLNSQTSHPPFNTLICLLNFHLLTAYHLILP
uniref:PnFL-3 n=1 Tax=Ipomoea nil TaxID=35883 RepID=Q9AXP6_IPONI|nr:PnFL-3 [Ipomoea nil]